jgi:hypothetical protein
MEKKLLLQDDGKTQKAKEISMMQNPQNLQMILGKLSWKILTMLSEKEMYPLEIARQLGVHEQTVSPAFGIEFPKGYKTIHGCSLLSLDEKIQRFFREFVNGKGVLEGKIVVGSPTPHGPFKTSARDGHYAAHLTLFMGQFAKMPLDFAIKLDVDVKAEKEEKGTLILVGGPGTNLLTQEINEYLPIRFNMQSSSKGFLLGGLSSNRTSRVYTADSAGLIAKILNPWDKTKRIVVLAGNKAVGTKACVLGLTNFWKKTLQEYRDDDTFATVIQGFDLDGDGKVDSIEVLE